MKNKNILISGAGIAGLTLAYWLKKYGFNPTVVEIAPMLREGGYMIDFWGVGFDVAEKMGIIPDLEKAHYEIPEIEFVDRHNKRKGGFNIRKLRSLVDYRHFNFLRGNLAQILYQKLPSGIAFIFGNSIQNLEQCEENVKVTLDDGTSRTFDLVIGADGLHSQVRNLLFGPEAPFEIYLGYYTASFTIDNYLGKDRIFYSYSTPGRQVGIYSIRENKLSAFFIFKSQQKLSYNHHDTAAQKKILIETFQNEGWECRQLLEKMDGAPDFYFDTVSQIQLNPWSKGRITLAGDACQCVSLVSGQGAALAMAGAYILAGELKQAEGDFPKAFQKYEALIKPEIESKQKKAQNFASSFVPDSSFGIWIRNTFTNLMFLPIVSQWFIRQFLSDKLILKPYKISKTEKRNEHIS